MPALALARSIIPARVLAVLLAILVVTAAVIVAFAAARGVPVAHHVGMSYGGKPNMSFN